MSARAAQALASGLFRSTKRTFQPLHRDTKHAGERELDLWRRHNTFSRGENNARMRAAELVRRMTRQPTEVQRDQADRAESAARLENLGLEHIVQAVADPELRRVLTSLSVGL